MIVVTKMIPMVMMMVMVMMIMGTKLINPGSKWLFDYRPTGWLIN